MTKTALITGITGQDGAYLARFLIDKGYDVHGIARWDSHVDPAQPCVRLRALDIQDGDVTIHTGDLTDVANISHIIKNIQPHEIYNLGAMTQVAVSFDTAASTIDINTKGALAIFDAVRLLGMEERVRIYQASSSEMFGSSPAPQNEETAMHPCSPYGVAKLAAYWLAKTYRDAYGMFISNGILFNHESPYRGEDFVTKKISKAVAEIKAGRAEPLMLGNLDSVRDWGHSRDYVRGMWLMLNHDRADDFVLATGQARSVRDFVETAFAHVGYDIAWSGEGEYEVGADVKSGRILVRVDEALFRPKDVNYLLGDARKAKADLKWQPEIMFEDLVREMMEADLDDLGLGRYPSYLKVVK